MRTETHKMKFILQVACTRGKQSGNETANKHMGWSKWANEEKKGLI